MKKYSYKKATEYILSIPKFTAKTELSNTAHFLDLLGNPEKDIPVIHVAGTNGKGSVCKMLACIAEEAGYRTGLFISPHLIRINERISVNGEEISDKDFARLFSMVKDLVPEAEDSLNSEKNQNLGKNQKSEMETSEKSSSKKSGEEKAGSIKIEEKEYQHPAYFEFLFLMAAVYFKEQNCDLIIYETGLGGKLDATSVVTPDVCAITSIGLDHMQYLGNTIEEIAGEKAGIIREGVPVVINTGSKAADTVIEKVAKENKAPLFNIQNMKSEPLMDEDFIRKILPEGAAPYQVDNARTAIVAFEKLAGGDIYGERYKACVKEALARFNWPGRMQWLADNVVIDGAHNEDAIARFIESVNTIVKNSDKFEKVSLLFAVSSDKDYESMITELCNNLPIEDIYVSEINSDRKTAIDQVMKLFKEKLPAELSSNVYGSHNLKRMYELAQSELADDTLLAIVGSLYMVGEILSYQEK